MMWVEFNIELLEMNRDDPSVPEQYRGRVWVFRIETVGFTFLD